MIKSPCLIEVFFYFSYGSIIGLFYYYYFSFIFMYHFKLYVYWFFSFKNYITVMFSFLFIYEQLYELLRAIVEDSFQMII